MSSKLRVGIVFGGRSVEHEVSIVSARSVIEAIDKEKFDVVPIGVTKDGRWLSEQDSKSLLDNQRVESAAADLSIMGNTLLSALHIVFPLIHGAYGEDGRLQGMLELASIPYVGSGPLASALGMDKDMMKRLFGLRGLPVVRYRSFFWHEWNRERESTLRSIMEELSFPLFVKPANTGSSVGITKVKEKMKLGDAIEDAFKYDNKVIVEQGIDAREIECSVLGNEEPLASVPGEIVPCNEFYDYRAKYIDERSELIIPAQLPPETSQAVRDIAIRAFTAIECSGMARVDFLLERGTDQMFVNELNTIPGFTPISMYPKLWEASGISYKELITRLIELGMERHRLAGRLVCSYTPDEIR